MKPHVLIIDDDSDYTLVTQAQLESFGYAVQTATSISAAHAELHRHEPDLILLDVMLGNESGIALVPQIKNKHPHIGIIMISSQGNTATIVDAMQAGASDYILKPVDFELLRQKLATQLELKRARTTAAALSQTTTHNELIGTSQKTRQLVHDISKVATSDATVFLRGESGTGKSLIAEVIHRHSNRHEHPFVTINCAAIPANLLESELFGHEKGAFTGAIKDKPGKFELANRGTIFLDEIGELNPELQVKILRVLQAQEFERVGGLKTIKVNVRIIAATNRNIEAAVAQHTFREDLFYRLNVLPIYVPPLRERAEDIPLLAQHYLNHFAARAGKRFAPFSAAILNLFTQYAWPGNIRELQNVIERAVILGTPPELTLNDFAINVSGAKTRQAAKSPSIQSVGDIEYQTLIRSLESFGGNMTKAAHHLGIGRDTLYRRLRKYGIQPKRTRSSLL